MKSFNYLFFLAGFIGHICAAQSSDLKSIEEVISGIDSLLEQIDESSSIKSESTKLKNQELQSTNPPDQRSYRLENELMPEELRVPINDLPVDQIGKAGNPPGASPQDPLLNPVSNKPTISTLPRSVDYSKLSLDDLLREVDMLKNPSMPGLGTIIEPLPVSSTSPDKGVAEHLLLPTKEYSQSELPEIEPAVIQDASRPNSPTEIDIVVDDYIVLGNEIDQELKEKFAKQLWLPACLQVEQGILSLLGPFIRPPLFATGYLGDLRLLFISVIAEIFYWLLLICMKKIMLG